MSKPQQGQQELFTPSVTWFHIFTEMIRSGTWARMSPACKALYPTIKAFTNWKDGRTFPSLDTLVEYSGLSRPSVVKGLRELEELGYIRKKATPGKSTIYTLVEKFDIKDEAGESVATASFDYLPSIVGEAMVELRNYVAKNMKDDGSLQFIKVDKFVIENLTVVQGSNNIGTQNNTIDGSAMLKGIRDKLDGVDSTESILIDSMLDSSSKI